MIVVHGPNQTLCFSLQSDPPLTELDPGLPASTQASDVLMNPPEDFLIDPLMEPAGSQSESKPASEVMSEPSDFEDLTNNLIDSPVETGENSAAEATMAAMETPLDEAAEEFFDILGSETEAAQEEEEVVANVAVAAESDQSEVTGGAADQTSDVEVAAQEPEAPPAAAIIDLGGDSVANSTQPLGSNQVANPLIDILGEAPLAAEAKKPKAQAPVDLFDDDGSDLFTEPWPSKTAAQPASSLFREPDEDLFGEPLGAAAKKPAVKEQQQSKSVAAKAPEADATATSAIGGPLLDAAAKEPADIFSEEAVATAPSIKNADAVKSKTNGLHSEEESDIFAGR